jgi:dienelactone hydrolase
MFTHPDAKPPLDRSPQNGFRCVRYSVPPGESMQAMRRQNAFPTAPPVNDDAFRSYAELFAYQPKELNARIERTDESHPDWIRQDISYEPSYEGERVRAVLFLPKNAPRPTQAVVFHASAGALQMKDARYLDGTSKWDFLVRGGRAVLHPVVPGAYGRLGPDSNPVSQLAAFVQRGQDIRRAVDYLQSLPDMDGGRIAYMGSSWGAGSAPAFLAVEPRFRAAVLLDGGLFVTRPLPQLDVSNYAPRVHTPVLMINGRYDYFFPLEVSQKPMFGLLGTPSAQKRHVVLEASHDVAILRQDMMRETLDWLDRYLGPVKR